ncbi:hypothetical protein TNCT_388861 [Trichonephila clavata]|uniref:Uncharacterized protein n=1 Tax=Trichonephila clavata TaxID=2740835 RepID=A0A8X6HS51_TRICU|nr:hypothetical protein TNCT_388861 [Trichonephila clavata]
MAPIPAPAAVAHQVAKIPGRTAFVIAARPTPVATLAIVAKKRVRNPIATSASKAGNTAPTTPPITKGDKAVKLSPNPASAPITAPTPTVAPTAILAQNWSP